MDGETRSNSTGSTAASSRCCSRMAASRRRIWRKRSGSPPRRWAGQAADARRRHRRLRRPARPRPHRPWPPGLRRGAPGAYRARHFRHVPARRAARARGAGVPHGRRRLRLPDPGARRRPGGLSPPPTSCWRCPACADAHLCRDGGGRPAESLPPSIAALRASAFFSLIFGFIQRLDQVMTDRRRNCQQQTSRRRQSRRDGATCCDQTDPAGWRSRGWPVPGCRYSRSIRYRSSLVPARSLMKAGAASLYIWIHDRRRSCLPR